MTTFHSRTKELGGQWDYILYLGGEQDNPTVPEVARIRESSLGSCDSGRNLFRNASVRTDTATQVSEFIHWL